MHQVFRGPQCITGKRSVCLLTAKATLASLERGRGVLADRLFNTEDVTMTEGEFLSRFQREQTGTWTCTK
jgi:hypothetical protein